MRELQNLTIGLWMLMASAPALAETVVFVVAESGTPCFHCDAFLLPLSDPQDIADARAWLARGPGSLVGSIPVVELTAGADGLNRNPLAPGEPLWSWHVSGFSGFADFTIELCDGWPSFIESDPSAFIANTNGQFCPWTYSVVAELTTGPAVPSLGFRGGLGLVFALALATLRAFGGARERAP